MAAAPAPRSLAYKVRLLRSLANAKLGPDLVHVIVQAGDAEAAKRLAQRLAPGYVVCWVERYR